jgi:hypothetical protein
LGLVVIFTSRGAFNSLLAVVIVAAIGLAAVLLQLRLRNREKNPALHPPLWLNVIGVAFALAAVFADFLRLSQGAAEATALGAVGCFAVSGAIILHAFRKDRATSK